MSPRRLHLLPQNARSSKGWVAVAKYRWRRTPKSAASNCTYAPSPFTPNPRAAANSPGPLIRPRASVGSLPRNCRERPVSGTQQRPRRQCEYLFADHRFRQTAEVSDDRHMRRVFRPVADYVRDLVIHKTAVRDPQVAEVNEIIGAIAMLRKRIFRTRVQQHFRKARAQRLNRLLMAQKYMSQLNVLRLDDFEDRFGVGQSIEERALARDL